MLGGLEPSYMEHCQTVSSFLNLRVQLHLQLVQGKGSSPCTEQSLRPTNKLCI